MREEVKPAWVLALAGESIDVTFASLFSSIVQIVFIPVLAGSKGVILGAAAAAIAAVVLHNAIGLTAGNLVGRATGMSEDRVRATTFEVGLQNSGLAVALATAHFGGGLVALAPALFSVWHNVTGPALASYFSSRGDPAGGEHAPPESAD
ncbi:hypothetical protein GCM10009066_05800 [Halarchaeum salinum]|uniref:Bile acid:sodium symporter family protein n=1 Tax=Halarchaeum salinum TaxID=489912 RepID=A0AAV3S5D3_9EURY